MGRNIYVEDDDYVTVNGVSTQYGRGGGGGAGAGALLALIAPPFIPPGYAIYQTWLFLDGHNWHILFNIIACLCELAAFVGALYLFYRYTAKWAATALTMLYLGVTYGLSLHFVDGQDDIWTGATVLAASALGYPIGTRLSDWIRRVKRAPLVSGHDIKWYQFIVAVSLATLAIFFGVIVRPDAISRASSIARIARFEVDVAPIDNQLKAAVGDLIIAIKQAEPMTTREVHEYCGIVYDPYGMYCPAKVEPSELFSSYQFRDIDGLFDQIRNNLLLGMSRQPVPPYSTIATVGLQRAAEITAATPEAWSGNINAPNPDAWSGMSSKLDKDACNLDDGIHTAANAGYINIPRLSYLFSLQNSLKLPDHPHGPGTLREFWNEEFLFGKGGAFLPIRADDDEQLSFALVILARSDNVRTWRGAEECSPWFPAYPASDHGDAVQRLSSDENQPGRGAQLIWEKSNILAIEQDLRLPPRGSANRIALVAALNKVFGLIRAHNAAAYRFYYHKDPEQ